MKLLERAFTILQIIADEPEGIGVMAIATRAGLPKSTTSRILSGLEGQLGVVRSAENRFTIGPKITQLAASQSLQRSLTALAQPILQRLVDETQEAAALCLLDGQQVHYVAQVQSQQAVGVLDWTGQRFPLHVLAAGKLFLAYGSAEFTRSFLEQPLSSYTDKTLTATALLREIASVRSHGYAETDEEFADALVGFAAPILSVDGQCVAAINVFGPKFRFESAEKKQSVIQQMQAAAAELTVLVNRQDSLSSALST